MNDFFFLGLTILFLILSLGLIRALEGLLEQER
jgi:hypothetical protein